MGRKSWSSAAIRRPTPPVCCLGMSQKSVLDTLREEGEDVELENIRNSVMAEPGQLNPAAGAGRRLRRPGYHQPRSTCSNPSVHEEKEGLDYAFYDVLGDVVCGGFAMAD